MYIPKIHAIFCTRSNNFRETTKDLVDYYRDCNIKSTAVINSNSIFRGYEVALEEINPNPEDIIIFCHDDIKMLMDQKLFRELLITELSKPKAGFIGPAGTTYFGKDGTWWNMDNWKEGKHKGVVCHGNILGDTFITTYYGNHGQVAVLDGLFLACKYSLLQKIDITKPKFFEGDWDFYDIYFTYQALKKGYTNKACPILICHESFGNLAGRESWFKNKDAFLKEFDYDIPLEVK